MPRYDKDCNPPPFNERIPFPRRHENARHRGPIQQRHTHPVQGSLDRKHVPAHPIYVSGEHVVTAPAGHAVQARVPVGPDVLLRGDRAEGAERGEDGRVGPGVCAVYGRQVELTLGGDLGKGGTHCDYGDCDYGDS